MRINPQAGVSSAVSPAPSRHDQCGAKTKAGAVCLEPPLPGRSRCRLHGGASPGAPKGRANGNYRTGEWTSGAIRERKWLRALIAQFAS